MTLQPAAAEERVPGETAQAGGGAGFGRRDVLACLASGLRRCLRFKLRSLLLIVTGLALFTGYHADRARRQKHAVDVITRNGGQFTYDYEVMTRSPTTGAIERIDFLRPVPTPK